MKNIIIFLGYGTKRDTFMKKDIYKYLQKQGCQYFFSKN